jgi:hypothetical protein
MPLVASMRYRVAALMERALIVLSGPVRQEAASVGGLFHLLPPKALCLLMAHKADIADYDHDIRHCVFACVLQARLGRRY